jgi:hypothetical protein
MKHHPKPKGYRKRNDYFSHTGFDA